MIKQENILNTKMQWLLIVLALVLTGLVIPVNAQENIDHGSNKWTQWGVMDGNRVRTLFSNHGEIARHPDQPSGEWPKGSGHSYVDGVAFIVSAKTKDAFGNTITPMSTNYREFIDLDPITKVPWGFAPLYGFSNPLQDSPARSDDNRTWPQVWPDRSVKNGQKPHIIFIHVREMKHGAV